MVEVLLKDIDMESWRVTELYRYRRRVTERYRYGILESHWTMSTSILGITEWYWYRILESRWTIPI